MANKKTTLQIIIIAAVALILVLLLLIGILLIPSTGNVTPPSSDPASSSDDAGTDDTPVAVEKFTVTGRIFDKDGKAMANTRFSIDLGPTDFKTDSNGYFVLKNLPVGVYSLSGYDKDGNRIGTTTVQLSADGVFSIGYVFFEKDKVVTLQFDGNKFVAVEIKESNNQNSETVITPPEEKEDETLTNLSWMDDIAPEFGGYGLTAYRDPELFYDVLEDEQYDMFNTYLLAGNTEFQLRQAKDAAAEGKKIWLNVNDVICLGAPERPQNNLTGRWRELIDEYASAIYSVAGDAFQGFYFDEPSYHLTSMDFTRVTKYMREKFKRRVFAIHCKDAYLIPWRKGMDIVRYKMARDDNMVINAENHKYVTDMGWWRYGSLQRMAGLGSTIDQWTKACEKLVNPKVRKWITLPIGTYDWLSTEEETMSITYEMFKYNSQLEGFGGVLYYTFVPGPLAGRPGSIEPTDSRLTPEDFLKDENGEYVLDEDGERIVSVKVNNSMAPFPDKYYEGCGEYFVLEPIGDGEYRWNRMRQYMLTIGNGFKEVGAGRKTYKDILNELGSIYTPDTSTYQAEYWYDENGNFIPPK